MLEESDRLLSIREAAERLAIREATLRSWLRRGMLPKVYVGPRAVRVLRSSIEALIRDGFVSARERSPK